MIDVNALARVVYGTLAGLTEWAAIVLREEETRYARAERNTVRSVEFGLSRPVEGGETDARAA